MTFILTPERDDAPLAAFERYRAYVEESRDRFPPGALALVTSEWYFDAAAHWAPHDARLKSVLLEELTTPAATLRLKIDLLGAYNDLVLQFRYSGVTKYDLSGHQLMRGHADWRYDEFRVNDRGGLVHEIQWSGAQMTATWIIEAEDVGYTWNELATV